MDKLKSLRDFFNSRQTRSLKFRLSQLDQFEKLIRENQDQICEALYKDLRKPKHEAMIGEIAVLIKEIQLSRKKLKKWMKPKNASTPLAFLPAKSRLYYEPLGLVLVIGPWNYPFQLLLAPLVGAMAAGNCVVLKPSEHSPNTSKLVAELMKKYFSEDYICVIEGAVEETTELLSHKFDHIFFTGSTSVGRIIMQAAAKNLTPVTLELGGKSPVIVCEDADLDLAARRIVWGKFYNSGQTCVAPDYLYVHRSISEKFFEKVRFNIEAQFGSDPKQSLSYSRIVNARNFHRLQKLLDQKKLRIGGASDLEDLYIQPTVLGEVTWDDPVMKEEIFGPILPWMTYENFDDLLTLIGSKEKPLAAYIFSRNKKSQADFVEKLSFGGGCINDLMVQFGNPYLPFGGVGESGMGHCHGEYSFKTFSHSKSLMLRTGWLDHPARYAPYSEKKLNLLKRLFSLK